MSDTLGIIRDPHFGVGDRGTVALWFTVYVGEASAALQVFGVEDAVAIIAAYGVGDVADLNGKPCWLDTSTPGMIRWVKAAKL